MNRARRISLAFAVVAVAVVMFGSRGTALTSDTPPPGSPLAMGVHPRIYLTPATLPAMRAKLAGDFATEFQRFVQLMDEAAATVVADSAGWRNADNFMYALNFAFLYQVDPSTVAGAAPAYTKAQYGQIAKQILMQAAAGDIDSHIIPVTYDWIYDILTPVEREFVVADMIAMVAPKEDDNPWDDQPMYRRERWTTSGLAFYGEFTGAGEVNAGNVEAARRMNDFVRFIHGDGTSLETANSFVAGDDGGWSQGVGYSTRDATFAGLRALEARRTAFGLSRAEVFGDATVYRYYPQWIAALLLPQGGGKLWRTHSTDDMPVFGSYSGLLHLLSALRLYKGIDNNMAGLAQWLLDTNGSITLSTNSANRFYLFGHFIFGEKVQAKSPSEAGIPLSKHFESYGDLYMRTKWTANWVDAGDTFVGLSAARWARPTAYWQPANPSFTIDRGGPLVITAGTAGHQHYHHTAWSGNTMLFVDMNEDLSYSSNWDMGGHRQAFDAALSTDYLQPGSQWDVGGMKRVQLFQPGDQARDFDYVLSDATRVYNGPYNIDRVNTSKVARFTRHFVYFRPAAAGQTDRIVVFDRTETTGTEFEKRFLFHPSRRPTIGGTALPNQPVRGGSGEGKTTYTGSGNADISMVNNEDGSSGRLWVTPLLPASRNVVLVGGPNSLGEWSKPVNKTDPTEPSHEFENPYGFPNPDRNNYGLAEAQYVGQYRVEIIPTASALQTDFLNVFEAGGLANAKSSTGYVSGQNYRGVRVGDRIAVFATTAAVEYNGDQERGIASGDFTIDQAGSYRVLLTDLAPNLQYDVAVAGQTNRFTSSAQGTIYVGVNAAVGTRVSVVAREPIPELPPPPVPPAAPSTSAPSAPRNLRILAE
ncbi:MAG: hypothetical protein AB7G23_07585 [Vicinamibacterales bacterium]